MAPAGNGITVVVDAQNKTATAIGAAAKSVKTVGEAADYTAKQLQQMDVKLDSAETKARKLALAEEQAGEKTRRLAASLAAARHELEQNGDATGKLAQKIDRLATDHRFAAIATDEYRRAANRAAAEAREQARAYDRVADNARQAARAVAILGASAALSPDGKGGGGSAVFGAGAGGIRSIAGLGAKGLASLGNIGEATGVGALSTPIVGPALVALAIPIAAAAAAAIGGTTGGATTFGLGLGGAGLGLAGAWANNPDHYQAEWDALIDHVTKRWLESSKTYGHDLEFVLKTAAATADSLPIERLLDNSRGSIKPVATGLGLGVTNAASGLADASAQMQKIADNVGPKLAGLGHDIGDAFRAIGQGAEGGSHALGDFVDGLGYTIKAVGLWIGGLEDAYEKMRNFTIETYHFTQGLPIIGKLQREFADSFIHTSGSVISMGRALDSSALSGDHFGASLVGAAKSAASAQIEVTNLNDALTKNRDIAMGTVDATLQWAQGWLDMTEELKKGAKTLDLSSQEGINNQKVIVDQIKLAERARESTIENSDQTQAAIDAANQKYYEQVAAIRAAAIAAGFDKDKVDALIASLGGVPPTTTATVNTPGLGTAVTLANGLETKLKHLDGMEATANVYVAYHQQGQALNAPLRTGGFPHAAEGGARGGLTLVGEEGPELVRLPSGAMVYSRANTNQMLAGGASGLRVEIHVTGHGALFAQLEAAQRTGDLQILASAIVDN